MSFLWGKWSSHKLAVPQVDVAVRDEAVSKKHVSLSIVGRHRVLFPKIVKSDGDLNRIAMASNLDMGGLANLHVYLH